MFEQAAKRDAVESSQFQHEGHLSDDDNTMEERQQKIIDQRLLSSIMDQPRTDGICPETRNHDRSTSEQEIMTTGRR